MVHILQPGESIVVDEIESEPEFSTGHGYERFEMTADELTALLQKKMIFVQVQGEYTLGIVLVVRKEGENDDPDN